MHDAITPFGDTAATTRASLVRDRAGGPIGPARDTL